MFTPAMFSRRRQERRSTAPKPDPSPTNDTNNSNNNDNDNDDNDNNTYNNNVLKTTYSNNYNDERSTLDSSEAGPQPHRR